MFIDYPHKNKILKNKPEFIIKSLSNKKILDKEFYVLNFLKKQQFVPKVSNLMGNHFQEELLIGREITKIDLTEGNIKKLALILKKLHELKIPRSIVNLTTNSFLKNNKYQPTLIVGEIMKEVPIDIVAQFNKIIFNISSDIEYRLHSKKYKISLVHGDLSQHNIYLQNKELFLIDWSDCRLDISSCDVSQLFYLLKFNQQQKSIFLKYYKMDYIDDSLLVFQNFVIVKK